MRIEILKPHKLLEVGKVLDVNIEYSNDLIKRGIAKSLEVVEQIEIVEQKEVKTKKVK